VESTAGQSRSLIDELRDLLNPEADKEAGRLGLAERKTWMLQALEGKLEEA
jgi:hypothetical protein